MPKTIHFPAWRPDRLLARCKHFEPLLFDIIGRFPCPSYEGEDIMTIKKDGMVRTPSDHYGLLGTIKAIWIEIKNKLIRLFLSFFRHRAACAQILLPSFSSMPPGFPSRSYISLQRKPWFWPLWATAIRSQGMPWTWIHQLLRGSVSSSRSIFRWPRFHLLILRLSSPAQVSDIGNSISASKYRSHSNYAGSLRLLAELERDGLPEAQEIWAASGLERALKMSN